MTGSETPTGGPQPPSPAAPCPVCLGVETAAYARVADRRYGRCAGCRAVFLDPAQRPDPARERARYALHENNPGDPGYRAFLAALLDPLLARLGPAREGLDYGCGPGPALAAMLAEAGHTVRLYDPFFFPDPAVLARSYDFITCTEVVEHFHRPAAEFARLDGLLRPGGWLGIMTALLTDGIDLPRWHYANDFTHVVFYHAATFAYLAARFGWDCEIRPPNVVLLHKR